MPTARNKAKHRPEQAGQQATAVQQNVEFLFGEGAAAPDVAKGLPQVGQDDDIRHRDDKQEQRRDQRTDNAAYCLEGVEPKCQRHRCAGDPSRR